MTNFSAMLPWTRHPTDAMRLQLFLLLNSGFSDRRSCLTVSLLEWLCCETILLSSRLQLLLGVCVLGETQQINQSLRRLNAATGDFVHEAGSATSLAAPLWPFRLVNNGCPHHSPFMPLCETVSIVMTWHYAKHIHFWQQNKSPAFIFTPFIFIFLCMFTVWVNGALYTSVQMTSQFCPPICPQYSGSMGCCVHSYTETARTLKAQGLPDDGVTETSAMEVQMVALGTLYPVEAEKYDFNLSKLYWLRRLLQPSSGCWCRQWVVDWLQYSIPTREQWPIILP